MGANYIQIPADSTGKKVRTVDVVVGADTVHQHFFVLAGDDGSIIDWGGSNAGNPLSVLLTGNKSGGGFNQCLVDTNPTLGTMGLYVNAMPVGTTPITVTGTGGTANVGAAGTWATSIGQTDNGLYVNARSHQGWPGAGQRAGISGDSQFYSQNQNDLGDLMVSLGSITSLSGSVQIDCSSGTYSAGTLRVVVATNQPAIPINDNGSSITVDGSVLVATGGTPLDVSETALGTATLTNVSASATSVTVVFSHTGRRGLCLYNDSSSQVYIKYGDLASSTSFTFRMDAFSYYEIQTPAYTGTITGIWDTATGTMRVTELTA